jgi:hypothetical protein
MPRQGEPQPSGEARCQCGPNVAMGSYDAQVVMLTPFRRGPLPQLVGIDACIATEIAWLWLDGIETVASCCGHNKAPAIISVIEDDAERMERLGYELYEYPPGQDGWRWTYRAKSVSRCNAPEPAATVPRSEVASGKFKGKRPWRVDGALSTEIVDADREPVAECKRPLDALEIVARMNEGT